MKIEPICIVSLFRVMVSGNDRFVSSFNKSSLILFQFNKQVVSRLKCLRASHMIFFVCFFSLLYLVKMIQLNKPIISRFTCPKIAIFLPVLFERFFFSINYAEIKTFNLLKALFSTKRRTAQKELLCRDMYCKSAKYGEIWSSLFLRTNYLYSISIMFYTVEAIIIPCI